MDVGAMTVFLYTFQQREIIYNLTEQLTGARFTTSYTRVGGQIRDLTPTFLSDLTKFLDGLEPVIDETNGLLTRNAIFMARTEGIGVISKEDAISYGLTGPNLRASGVEFDMRKNHPYLGYEQFEFDIPVGTKGDCYDRYLVRMEETKQSIRILRQLIKNFPSGEINVANQKGFLPKKEKVLMSMEELIHHFIIATQGIDVPPGEVYFGAENPKGELGFYIHSKGGGVPYRLKIRAPSFVNLSILPKVLKGHTMSDLVAILGSLDFVMGECDR
jgi:NADH-quinone oxidoreductase subunit D